MDAMVGIKCARTTLTINEDQVTRSNKALDVSSLRDILEESSLKKTKKKKKKVTHTEGAENEQCQGEIIDLTEDPET